MVDNRIQYIDWEEDLEVQEVVACDPRTVSEDTVRILDHLAEVDNFVLDTEDDHNAVPVVGDAMDKLAIVPRVLPEHMFASLQDATETMAEEDRTYFVAGVEEVHLDLEEVEEEEVHRVAESP